MEEVNIVNDNSVERKIEETAQKLKNKYNNKRNINEKLLKKPSNTPRKIIGVIFDVVVTMVVVFCSVIFFSAINCRLSHVVPSFAGYSSLNIVSDSMEGSGFRVGQTVIVKKVAPKTLKRGNVIAFYNYEKSSNNFNINEAENISDPIGGIEYPLDLQSFFGVQNAAIREAGRENSQVLFHEIVEIYDVGNTRYFKTKGTSNDYVDPFYVNENLVIGVYTNSSGSAFVSGILSIFNKPFVTALFILVPLLLIGVVICIELLRDIEISKLCLDVVEEKRKLTDPICLKNHVGYFLSSKDKYKVLVQAKDEEKDEYVKLLWRPNTVPQNIRKYCLKKKVYLRSYKRLLEVNRECERRLKAGESESKVAEYYAKEKEIAQNRQLEFERRFRNWTKK